MINKKQLDAILENNKLKSAEKVLLIGLISYPDKSQTSVANIINMPHSYCSVSVHSLARKGLLKITKKDGKKYLKSEIQLLV